MPRGEPSTPKKDAKEEKKASEPRPSMARQISDAFTKPIRGWEPRRTDGTHKFDKPIRGWEKAGRVTMPTFKSNTATVVASNKITKGLVVPAPPGYVLKKGEVNVKCPVGADPGDTVEFTVPDGRTVQVKVPPGVKGGDFFLVSVPDSDGEYSDGLAPAVPPPDFQAPPPPPPPNRPGLKGPHVLVTGGQGYIGTHCVLRLLEEGYVVTVVDSGLNSHSEALQRVRELVTPEQASHLFVHELDLCDSISLKATMMAISQVKKIDACLHLAGLSAADKSLKYPVRYHQANVTATMNLIESLAKHGCRRLVFSSTAHVYGPQALSPINEGHPIGRQVASPFARGKYMVEQILEDIYHSKDGKHWGIVSLRYFNAVGAHPSGKIGEDPMGAPSSNPIRDVAQVALGRRESHTIFGDSWDTADGTCVRDYLHVMDLAEAHLAALKKLREVPMCYSVYNLGSGKGVSDLEVVTAMEAASGLKIKAAVGKKKQTDVATLFVSGQLAAKELGWTPKLGLDRICKDLWRWNNANPTGYVRPQKEFGAFKQPSFSKSNMPKLSSSKRNGNVSRKYSSMSSSSSGGSRASRTSGGLSGGADSEGGISRLNSVDEYAYTMGETF